MPALTTPWSHHASTEVLLPCIGSELNYRKCAGGTTQDLSPLLHTSTTAAAEDL